MKKISRSCPIDVPPAPAEGIPTGRETAPSLLGSPVQAHSPSANQVQRQRGNALRSISMPTALQNQDDFLAMVSSGTVEVARRFASKNRVDFNATGSGTLTPLTAAIGQSRNDMVRMLLGDDDIDPNLSDKDGCSPLTTAACENNLEILQTLLMHPGISAEAADMNGQTALDYAQSLGNDYMAFILEQHLGKKLRKDSDDGSTSTVVPTAK